MIHLYLFGPQQLIEPLIALSEVGSLIDSVGDTGGDSDATLYERLNESVETRLAASSSPGQSSSESSHVHDDVIIVLTPTLGDRFSTIALSIPVPTLYVVSGVNVGMLKTLRSLPTPIAERLSPLSTPQLEELDSEEEDPLMSSGSTRVEFNDEGETVLLTVKKHQTMSRSDSLARALCELLWESARSDVIFLNALLREEDDESAIDLSILESEFM